VKLPPDIFMFDNCCTTPIPPIMAVLFWNVQSTHSKVLESSALKIPPVRAILSLKTTDVALKILD